MYLYNTYRYIYIYTYIYTYIHIYIYIYGQLRKKKYSVQSVTSVDSVGTASPLTFQNCRGRPLNRSGSKVLTDGTSQFFLAIFALAFFCVHTAVLAVNSRFSII